MRIPASTYRVQLHREFTFEELKKIIDYLHELGVSAIYAAPIGTATPGSTHGYDVVDPNRINPEVGSRSDLQELYHMLKEKDMTWLQDIVPNHMAFSTHNVKLVDVFERGQVSPYYNYFDINWKHPDEELYGKVMVPFLGKELMDCIRDGELTLNLSSEGITLSYFDDHYPVSVETIRILKNSRHLDSETVRNTLDQLEAAMQIPMEIEEWLMKKRRIFQAISDNDKAALKQLISHVNSDQDIISTISDHQHYRLCYWKITEKKINYRRFFTVNSLICLRMEDESVFNEYHRLISKMYSDQWIHGVRIDHIDGLNDPAGYLKRLRGLLGDDCYIVAEKILESGEALPEDWPIQGTSGYEFLSAVNKLLTDQKGSNRLVNFYKTIVPQLDDYEDLVLKNKKLILERHMAGELDNLVEYFFELDLQGRYSKENIKLALAALMLSLPVYRIYPAELPLWDWQMKLMEETFEHASKLQTDCVEELGYLRKLCVEDNSDKQLQKRFLQFLKRMMQFTGPLTAKGVEDTTFYVYNPLISHDEVGDAPDVLGTTVKEFHQKMVRRAITNPLSLNATATHDTKRGEDARVRLNLLSEIPDEWASLVRGWMESNKEARTRVNDKTAPALNDEYFIYQSIIGGFPEDRKVNEEWVARLKEYLIKVVREAKMFSSWEQPNDEYENACSQFIDRILAEDSAFLKTFLPFIERLISRASTYSIYQAVIKMTAPGIPDIYQGCELWDLSYVDPDNRRPVDYDLRSGLLQELKHAYAKGFSTVKSVLKKNRQVGAEKMYCIWRTLQLRNEKPSLFHHGNYIPLIDLTEHSGAIGYARQHDNSWCVVIIPFHDPAKKGWQESNFSQNFISLPADAPLSWRNIFTDEIINVSTQGVSLKELISGFPAAILVSVEA